MQAFHNNPSIKEGLINQLQAHYDADEIVKGVYWENGRGCSIGCAVHCNDPRRVHFIFSEKYNIPIWLSKVNDKIFEGLPHDKAKEWPILFAKAVNLGSYLNKIKIPFLIFIVESVLDKFDHDKYPKIKKSILNILLLLKEENIDKLKSAASAAYSAASAAYSAASAASAAADFSAYSASDSAYSAAYAADSSDSAAYFADFSAYFADFAASAAYATAYAADSAAAYAADYYSAKHKSYEKFADKLIELISSCH